MRGRLKDTSDVSKLILNQNNMKELKKQHLEMLQLLESIEVMLQNGDSIHPNSVIRGAIQTAIGMDVNLNNKKQTAVEWFAEITAQLGYVSTDILEQAKAMEKEQMHKCASFWRGKENEIEKPIFEQYYNETFKSE